VLAIQSPETIFALATPPGRGALAVVRVSGCQTPYIVRALIGRLPKPRMATLANILDPASSQLIDHALVYWFPGPESFTGEDCAEFSIHGSNAVLTKLYAVLREFPSTRIARSGEFSKRALLNGKLSLLEVESLADLILAETEQQRLLGIQGLSGRLQCAVDQWRDQILSALINVESVLDFSDEMDVQAHDREYVAGLCNSVISSIDSVLAHRDRARLVRHGFAILISGPPNAGKSTLLNELAQRDVAIISDLPGTTRDLIEVQLDLGGYLVNLVDSAGVRDTIDEIELIGISRALARAKKVNLILWLCDHREPVAPPSEFAGQPIWRVLTKCDIVNSDGVIKPTASEGDFEFCISAKMGQGLSELVDELGRFVSCNVGDEPDVLAVNERQSVALENAKSALSQIVEGIVYPEVVAAKLREAAFELEILIGRIGVEDVLDEIFSRFCIGK